MTVNEIRERIKNELIAAKESFGEASSIVDYIVDVEENNIEGAPVDVTCVFGSLTFGTPDASEDDKLYLPLDAELNDDDTVDDEAFEKSLELFKERVNDIRERVLASSDYEAEIKAVIADFDRDMEEKYLAEVERLNKIAKRNLAIAGIATAAAAVLAAVILILQKLA